MTLSEKILAAAEKEIGVKEIPLGSNRGPRVQDYQATTWLRGTGWPWCVALAWTFVVWHKVLRKPCPYPTASVAQLEAWARENGWAIPVASMRPGDLACLNRGEHVTICARRTGSTFDGLGGNQSHSVRYTTYRAADVSTAIRVPVKLAPADVKPAKRKPVYEVVRGEGEAAKVVFSSPSLDKALGKVATLLRKGAKGARIRKRPA